MTSGRAALVLRLAGPMQAWGVGSRLNRRDTAMAPTKSGIVGLLAAAGGLRRQDPIEDLVALAVGVRVDRPGTVLRDFHTVSDYRGRSLLSAQVDAKGHQRRTSPAKNIAVTQRFYLQDAVFVAAVAGETSFVEVLAQAVRRPAFPLYLGRRSCVPTQPILIVDDVRAPEGIWDLPPLGVLETVAWQAPLSVQRRHVHNGPTKRLAVSLDADQTDHGPVELVRDVPSSFDPLRRAFDTRPVRHTWVEAPLSPAVRSVVEPTGHDPFEMLAVPAAAESPELHDPFDLLTPE